MSIRLNGSTSGYTEIDAPAVAGSNTLVLPTGNGSADQALVTNGSGTLSFADRGRMTLATAQNSTSGTSIDFTGIPSWVKRITVMLGGVSTNGTSNYRIQVGVSSTAVTSGYVSGTWSVTTAVASAVTGSTAGFDFITASAGSVQHGQFIISKLTSTEWIGEGSFYDNNPTVRMAYVTGRVSGLSGDVNMLRVTTQNGTDTFDAGSINILYEG